ncbi:MAG: Mov34/MPN/PAD-1 family protein [Bacteroidota bacterium]
MKIGTKKRRDPIDIHQYSSGTAFPEGQGFDLFKDRKSLHNWPKNHKAGFHTYVDQMAWDAFIEFADSRYREARHEACGLIMGEYFVDEYGEFIVGTNFERGTGELTSPVLCEISYHDNARIVAKYAGTGFIPVVWIHSHPGYGIFYSGQDNQTLREKYYERFHLGVVVDNVQRQVGAYKMRDGQVCDFQDLHLIGLNQRNSKIHFPFGKLLLTKEQPIKRAQKPPEVKTESQEISSPEMEYEEGSITLDIVEADTTVVLEETGSEFLEQQAPDATATKEKTVEETVSDEAAPDTTIDVQIIPVQGADLVETTESATAIDETTPDTNEEVKADLGEGISTEDGTAIDDTTPNTTENYNEGTSMLTTVLLTVSSLSGLINLTLLMYLIYFLILKPQ